MDEDEKKYSMASVKVMRSYDYCHFEVQLGLNVDEVREISIDGQKAYLKTELIGIKDIDEMRKEAARLADNAVYQYKIAKRNADRMIYGNLKHQLEKEVKIIRENYPKLEWTEKQKATVKALEDFQYYEYQDDWDDDYDY